MDLLQRFTRGEIDAFETLVHQFQGDIYAWTVRIVRDAGVAEDLTVETLWHVYRARQKFRPDGNFGAWARRIATNLAIDHLRRNRPEQSLLADPVEAPRPDPLVQRETHERIQQAFRRLPAKLQVAATLALVKELPYHWRWLAALPSVLGFALRLGFWLDRARDSSTDSAAAALGGYRLLPPCAQSHVRGFCSGLDRAVDCLRTREPALDCRCRGSCSWRASVRNPVSRTDAPPEIWC